MAASPGIEVKNDRQIGALKAKDSPYFVTVQTYPGLRIRVSSSRGECRRVFLYRYRKTDGKLGQQKIGEYVPKHFGLKQAIEKWREFRDIRSESGTVHEVVEKERREKFEALSREQEEQERQGYTVESLIEDFITYQSRQIKTWKKYEQLLKLNVVPQIGTLPASSVKRRDIAALLDLLTRDGKDVTANRTLAAIRKMYNWAVIRDKHGIENNPCTGLKPQKEHGRERFLADSEIKRLFVNLPASELDNDLQDLLKFILLTGCRLGEAAGANLTEFDIGGKAPIWTLPAERAKNGRELRLPISSQLKALIKRHTGDSDWLFPMETDPERPMRPDRIHTPLRKALPKLKVLPFTPHDLRHTFVTGMGKLGAPPYLVARMVNHTDNSVTSRYLHTDYTEDMRPYLQKWAKHLSAIGELQAPSATKTELA